MKERVGYYSEKLVEKKVGKIRGKTIWLE